MARKKLYGEWGMGPLPANLSDYLGFYNGWILVTNWKQIEPQPNVFDFSVLQADMNTLKAANLNIGVTVWVNPKIYLPNWLFNNTYRVPTVTTTNPAIDYGYYFDSNGNFKSRLFNMHEHLIDFIVNNPASSNVLFFQSAEGHEGQAKAYIGAPPANRAITAAQFMQWQKDIWQHDYDYTKVLTEDGIVEVTDIILNAADNDELRDYILANLPSAWIKRAIDGSDYGYNLESFDWTAIDAENAITLVTPGLFRKRSDLSFTVNRPWYRQAYGQNTMQVILNALAKGVDILNISTDNLGNVATHATVSSFFNDLAGNDSPIGMNKTAWCAFSCKIDGSDTLKWPISIYGHVLTGGADVTNNNQEYITKANITRLNAIKNANPGTLLDTTQFGQNAGTDTRLNDKYNSDIGMKVKAGPIGKFLTQPNWATESKQYYRIGNPSTDYWGRYAVGFVNTTTNKNLYFKLDTDWKTGISAITVKVVYWNAGNCQWRIKNSSSITILTNTNTNTQEWLTISADLNSGFVSGQLLGTTDLTLEYVAGNNTVRFAAMVVYKKPYTNILPTCNAGGNQQITGTTATLTATAADSDGTIVSNVWSFVPDLSTAGLPIPVIASPTTLSTGVTGMSTNGVYVFEMLVTDNLGGTASATTQVTKVTILDKPTVNAGQDQTITLPVTTATVGGTDTAAAGFTIASRVWSIVLKPTGAADPTFGTGTAATTTVNGMTVSGSYTFRKTATDNQVIPQSNSDDVSITVLPQVVNNPPIVDAGGNQQVTGTTATLTGLASDTDGTIASQLWTLVSGPVTPSITTPTALTTGITGMSTNGAYVFKLTATDNLGASTSDTTTVTKTTTVVAPTARAGADKTITQPTSTTTVGDTDIQNTFPIASRLWSVVSVPSGASNPTFGTPTTATTTVNNLSTVGTYVVKKRVSDNQTPANFTEDSCNIIVNEQQTSSIQFGILIAGTVLSSDQKMGLMDQFNVTLLRTSSIMHNWVGANNEKMLIKLKSDNKKCALNCNFKLVGRNGSEKVPNPFVTGADLDEFLFNLDRVTAAFGPSGTDVIEFVTIENEPTTANFYSGPVEDYIAQVAASIPVCHANGVKVADGAVHVPYVNQVKTANENGVTLTGKAGMVQKIMNAYSVEWAAIDYTNVHSSIGPDGNNNTGDGNPSTWAKAFDYMRVKSGGKPVISNEWSVSADNPTALTAIGNQMRTSKLKYSTIYDGPNEGGGGALPFQTINGAVITLNDLGLAYQAVVQG